MKENEKIEFSLLKALSQLLAPEMKEGEKKSEQELFDILKARLAEGEKLMAELSGIKEKEKKAEEEFNANIEKSIKEWEDWKKEKELNPELSDSLINKVVDFLQEGALGRIPVELVSLLFRDMQREADIEEAFRKGELKGRNTKIEELWNKETSDVLPHLHHIANTSVAPPQTIFTLARQA